MGLMDCCDLSIIPFWICDFGFWIFHHSIMITLRALLRCHRSITPSLHCSTTPLIPARTWKCGLLRPFGTYFGKAFFLFVHFFNNFFYPFNHDIFFFRNVPIRIIHFFFYRKFIEIFFINLCNSV